jgi:SDR family mycofactocin-dependent oxidoreductase
MGKLDGKVAFITGAARGQGRSHAIRLAQEGADIIGVDICKQIDTVSYAMATPEDLAQTVKEVEATGRRMVARQADVRDPDQMREAFEAGSAELGSVGIVLANAGIGVGGTTQNDQQWHDAIAVNLTGVWNTVRVAIPSMIEAGQGGAIVLTSSVAGLSGPPANNTGLLAYVASKTGIVGLMRSWANYLAPHSIRVNVIAPTAVRTPMAANMAVEEMMQADPVLGKAMSFNAMPVAMIEANDISNTVLWLVSDDGKYVTGSAIPVDAGKTNMRN